MFNSLITPLFINDQKSPKGTLLRKGSINQCSPQLQIQRISIPETITVMVYKNGKTGDGLFFARFDPYFRQDALTTPPGLN